MYTYHSFLPSEHEPLAHRQSRGESLWDLELSVGEIQVMAMGEGGLVSNAEYPGIGWMLNLHRSQQSLPYLLFHSLLTMVK